MYDVGVLVSVNDLVHPFEAVSGLTGCVAVDLSVAGDENPEQLALAAHGQGHQLLPSAGELTADRVAALVQGSADPIIRVIFAGAGSACVHSGATVDPAARVREIQAWTATAGFARLVEQTIGHGPRPVPALGQTPPGNGSAAPASTFAR